MTLDRRRGIEEEDLGLILVAIQARGVSEGLQDIQEEAGFPDSGTSHQEGVINKLAMQDRQGDTMQGKTCQEFGVNGCMNGSAKAFG
jgi:hypothetical protein